jgi:hypothetical protein
MLRLLSSDGGRKTCPNENPVRRSPGERKQEQDCSGIAVNAAVQLTGYPPREQKERIGQRAAQEVSHYQPYDHAPDFHAA